MSLPDGARLGPYEIVSPIGSGGMGEVYKARDSRLGRTVAIKILPREFAKDPERRARFEREARAISALAHPHVCTLYDVGEHDGVEYLVMEHLEGESLADRLKRGPVPWEEAIEYAIQIASALHEAHRLGIVHRDLKPANAMITRSGARLLDFGLARLRPAPAVAVGGATATQPVVTAAQTVLGTLPYMSPEQLLGREADARSDIFSFGVLLFELLTGRLPFAGESGPSVMARILEKEPQIEPSHSLPPALERLIRSCLVKEPDQRWQSARDLQLELTWIRDRPSDLAEVRSYPPQRRALIASAAAVALLAAGAAGAVMGRRASKVESSAGLPVQFSIPLSPGEAIHEHNSSSVALTDDGSRIAYAVNRRNERGLYVRALAAASPSWIAGGERVASPFFSPDGQWIAFESGGTLKKIPVDGGTPVPLGETPYFAGGTWESNSALIVVPSFTGGLFRVDARGGRMQRLSQPDSAAGERAHLWPQRLPDGRLLFTIWYGGNFDESKIAIRGTDGRYKVVFEGGFHGRYSSGRLVFGRGSRLLAVPFDLDADRALGTAEQLVDGIAGDGGAAIALFAVDSAGSIAYVPGSQRPIPRSLLMLDRSGDLLETLARGRAFNSVRLSPDGQRLLFWIEETSVGVWMKHLARDPLIRLTFDDDDHGPAWSPDGRLFAYESGRASTHQIFIRATDGTGGDRQLTTGEHHHYLSDWRGGNVMYVEFHPETGADLWIVNVDGPPRPRVFRATRFSERHASFSPDGRWVAYTSSDSGRNEVYVLPASGAGEKVQISDGGGEEPAWSAKGDRLYYRSGANMFSVTVDATGSVLAAGKPTVLFQGLYHYNIAPSRTYDVGPDERFYIVTLPNPAEAPRHVSMILNGLR